MPHKDPEKRKEWSKKYRNRPDVKKRLEEYRKDPENIKRATKLTAERRKKNPEHYLQIQKERYHKNLERYRRNARNSSSRRVKILKQEVYSHYANPMRCNCCGIAGIEFLTVDHIVPRNEMEKDPRWKSLGFSSKLKAKQLNAWLKRNNFPEGFQILCWNCNYAKGLLGKCPHQENF